MIQILRRNGNKVFLPAISLILILTMGRFMSSCYWENEETFYGEDHTCDTMDVSFSSDVLPILTNHCFSCHSNATAPQFGSGVSLEDYQDVANYASIIQGAIKHEDGFPAMPKNGPKLDACPISIVEAWINQGKTNN